MSGLAGASSHAPQLKPRVPAPARWVALKVHSQCASAAELRIQARPALQSLTFCCLHSLDPAGFPHSFPSPSLNRFRCLHSLISIACEPER